MACAVGPARAFGDNAPVTTVRQIGERALIERLAERVSGARLELHTLDGFELRTGIGDDAAVWRLAHGLTVTTTDTMVEGTHFTPETASWGDVGWKLWTANVSDVAAMGGTPLAGVVTLGLPPATPLRAVDDLYDGMLEACRSYGTLLVGGDIVASPTAFFTVAMSGACIHSPLTRAGGRAGDAVAVTGPLGASAAGLLLLLAGRTPSSAAERSLAEAHRRPCARVDAGQRLLEAGVRCAMDLSDGLVADLGKLALASGCGARIDASAVPVAPAAREVFPDEAPQLALGGGEDYELVFAGPAPAVGRAVAALPRAAVVGELTRTGPGAAPGAVAVVDDAGRPVEVAEAGWEHLR